MEQKISVIVPAYNESKTVAAVVSAARGSAVVGEVIVVDDGSADSTAAIAHNAGATVIISAKNSGKAAAMEEGVRAAKWPFICFADADLIGFTPAILEAIVSPVLAGQYDMFIAIRGRQPLGFNHVLPYLPKIGGERCLTKEIWDLVPKRYKKNFQIELALNYFVRKNSRRTGVKVFPELAQTIKERKYGLIVGFWRRLKMIRDIIFVVFKLYLKEV